MQVHIFHYDAFSTIPGKGNPAGVVVGTNLPAVTMQEIARQVNFNETVFVTHLRPGCVSLRYFTPGHEVDLCGHATIAAFTALHERTMLVPKLERASEYLLGSNAGELPIRIESSPTNETLIWMDQPPAQFVRFADDPAAVAHVLGVAADDLVSTLPVVYGSTGLWTLVVPIRNLDAMRRMKPVSHEFPSVLRQMPRASLHPFCLETIDPLCQMHGRHFSSPYSGTVEDPVTGTASGVLGAYYARHISPARRPRYSLLIEQGQEVHRDGRVHVEVVEVHGEYHVRVGGTAVFVGDLEVDLT